MNIIEKFGERCDKCTACGACMNICPVNAISFTNKYDKWFLYPEIDKSRCIDCGLCEKVCPIGGNIGFVIRRNEPIVYAVAADEIQRSKSSSGAVFPTLAEYIQKTGGYIVGAEFDFDWNVQLTLKDENESIDSFRQSKYVNTIPNKIYKDVKKKLEEKINVLFTGTPCQVAGLYSYLGKEYDNLYTMDFVCHGVPSDRIFQKYLKEISGGKKIKSINFRKKKYGWDNHNFFFEVVFDDKSSHLVGGSKDPYMKSFLDALCNREICGKCEYAKLPRIADITVADCWGIEKNEPDLYDAKGLSWLSINSEQGETLFSKVEDEFYILEKYELCKMVGRNWCFTHPKPTPPERDRALILNESHSVKDSYSYAIQNKYDIILVGNVFGKNYGSMLSVWCLYKLLKSYGYEVLVAPIIGNKPVKGTIVESFVHLSYDLRDLYDKEVTWTNLRKLNDYGEIFVLASEQYWNTLFTGKCEQVKLLSFVDDSKWKVSIAPSINSIWWGQDIIDYKEKKFWLSRFDKLSVREINGAEQLKSIFDLEAEVIMDPVLIVGKDVISGLLDREKVYNEKTILGYFLDPNLRKDLMIEEISRCYNLPFKIASFVEDNALREKGTKYTVLSLQTNEWISSIKDAELLVTDSYHGLCLALLFHVEFIVVPHEKRGIDKINSLLELVKLTERIINDRYEGVLKPIEWNTVDDILEKYRIESINWIQHALIEGRGGKSMTEFDIYRKMEEEKKLPVVSAKNKWIGKIVGLLGIRLK